MATAYDPADPYSRRASELPPSGRTAEDGGRGGFRFGLPSKEQLRFFGSARVEALYHASIERLRGLGGIPVTIDYEPFARTGRSLYEGPWVAHAPGGGGEVAEGTAGRAVAGHPNYPGRQPAFHRP